MALRHHHRPCILEVQQQNRGKERQCSPIPKKPTNTTSKHSARTTTTSKLTYSPTSGQNNKQTRPPQTSGGLAHTQHTPQNKPTDHSNRLRITTKDTRRQPRRTHRINREVRRLRTPPHPETRTLHQEHTPRTRIIRAHRDPRPRHRMHPQTEEPQPRPRRRHQRPGHHNNEQRPHHGSLATEHATATESSKQTAPPDPPHDIDRSTP